MSEAKIHLGTCSFTASSWQGSFYPRGMKPADYLSFYAEHFETVEVDSTFYACPTAKTVNNWNLKTPRGFIFSVKVPQSIKCAENKLQRGNARMVIADRLRALREEKLHVDGNA